MTADRTSKLKQLVVIPRWGGTPADDWYPWLASKLNNSEFFNSVHIGHMPEPNAPTIPAWTRAIERIVGTDTEVLRNTVLVGHSVAHHRIR